jgi:putative membrane protein
MVAASLAGLPAFLLYLCVAGIAVILFLYLYTRFTPLNEYDLIKANVPGVAIALGLSLVGFALPVASAIAHSAHIVDVAVWSAIALAVQLLTFFLARIPVPDLPRRIADGEFASAIWLGLVSITAGVLSAASMSY